VEDVAAARFLLDRADAAGVGATLDLRAGGNGSD
jgi:ornithine cyclodeaminase/alanine dehydrogenase-like protein (mu-crystallin family)